MRSFRIDLVLETVTHLTTGGGEGSAFESADIVQFRRLREEQGRKTEKVCIPATTFKGLLRASAVQIAHFISTENYCKTVDTDKLSNCENCIICKIFGRNNRQSKIYCEDFYTDDISTKELKQFTQTTIERNSRKSKERSLFVKDQIPPNIQFKSSIFIKDYDNTFNHNEELLLLAALKNITYTSFGNGDGLVDIKISKLEGFSLDNETIKNIVESMRYAN